MAPDSEDYAVVYSSETAGICPRCSKTQKKCRCKEQRAKEQVAAARCDGILRVGRATKGRKGKGVTTVTGVPLKDSELKKFAKELKMACGTGGTIKDGVIEIQGDHRDQIMDLLDKKGWKAKRAGG